MGIPYDQLWGLHGHGTETPDDADDDQEERDDANDDDE